MTTEYTRPAAKDSTHIAGDRAAPMVQGEIISSHDRLVARLQETPLISRLEEVQKRIGNMASSGRGIKMCIPVEHTDDDFFICQTARDAIQALLQNAAAPGELKSAHNEAQSNEKVSSVPAGMRMVPVEMPLGAVKILSESPTTGGAEYLMSNGQYLHFYHEQRKANFRHPDWRPESTFVDAPQSAHKAMIAASPVAAPDADRLDAERLPGNVKPDTAERVHFYEQDFYVLSNFSSFRVKYEGLDYQTSEHAYHCQKFPITFEVRRDVFEATSAHEAFKFAERYKSARRPDWDDVKVGIMRKIIRAKADQHEYVKRKLLQTGTRELVEDSWRDDFWGWGPNRDGQNMLGKLWMELRAEYIASQRQGGQS